MDEICTNQRVICTVDGAVVGYNFNVGKNSYHIKFDNGNIKIELSESVTGNNPKIFTIDSNTGLKYLSRGSPYVSCGSDPYFWLVKMKIEKLFSTFPTIKSKL